MAIYKLDLSVSGDMVDEVGFHSITLKDDEEYSDRSTVVDLFSRMLGYTGHDRIQIIIELLEQAAELGEVEEKHEKEIRNLIGDGK